MKKKKKTSKKKDNKTPKIKSFIKKWMILLIVLCVIILLLGIYFFLYSNLHIKGKDEIKVNYKSKYVDKGATYKLFNKDLSKKIKVKSNVNTKKMGNYKVTYSINVGFIKLKKTKEVTVTDTEAPKITLKGEKETYICPDGKYEEEGFEAIDNIDGDLTKKVKTKSTEKDSKDKKDSYKIIYTVKDKLNNKAKKERKIIKKDKEPPQITLKGNDKMYIGVSYKYNDPGYDVIDNCDTEIDVKTDSNLNVDAPGEYTITYTATDKSGNTSSVTRTVVVQKQTGGTGVIYLTFDDGPSGTGSTEKILNVLSKYGVKATFFVTCNGPANLIKREYNEGHTVAIHTCSHNYGNIYSSVGNYFADLERIRNVVAEQTGTYPKVMRFPGGSNNTVSNKYSYGIMNTLTIEAVNRGYAYFDWNVSSGDAGDCSTPNCVYSNVVNGLSKSKINIVLMHDIKMYTANALEDIIKYGQNNGYTFGVLSESVRAVRFK